MNHVTCDKGEGVNPWSKKGRVTRDAIMNARALNVAFGRFGEQYDAANVTKLSVTEGCVNGEGLVVSQRTSLQARAITAPKTELEKVENLEKG